MYWTSLAAAALLGQNVVAQNMLRFACSQLVVERTDPLVNPGMTYTPHLHQIVGGNSFNVTMDPSTHDLAGQSTCTSCTFKEDLSNYWTAVMFFHHKNGSYIRVPQVGNGGPQGHLVQDGGLDVYYIPSGKTTAFQKVCTQTQTLTQDNGVGFVLICAPGLPHARWFGDQHGLEQSQQGQHLPPLLDLAKRQHFCRRSALLGQRHGRYSC
jgi:hypothetical protein